MRPVHGVHVPTLWKSGSLNFLEPSGSDQACTGIALPLTKILLAKLITNTDTTLLAFFIFH
jgi:hypothetical protein